jgi:cytochrome c oxidase subunit II
MRKRQFIFILFLALGAGGVLVPRAQAETAPRHIQIMAKRFTFEPTEVTLKKGEPVDLVLKSMDVAHGIRFRELNVEVKASKGGSGEVHFTPEQTGTFVGHCSVFCGSGHGSMTLKLHVVD